MASPVQFFSYHGIGYRQRHLKVWPKEMLQHTLLSSIISPIVVQRMPCLKLWAGGRPDDWFGLAICRRRKTLKQLKKDTDTERGPYVSIAINMPSATPLGSCIVVDPNAQ